VPEEGFFGPVSFLVPWFGAVGAVSLSLQGGFERGADWDNDYCYWYWSRPLVGAVTSTVSALIFQSDILAVGGQLPNQAHTAIAKNLLYFLIAFIAGYREYVFRDLVDASPTSPSAQARERAVSTTETLPGSARSPYQHRYQHRIAQPAPIAHSKPRNYAVPQSGAGVNGRTWDRTFGSSGVRRKDVVCR
jgi:hypothetical protein